MINLAARRATQIAGATIIGLLCTGAALADAIVIEGAALAGKVVVTDGQAVAQAMPPAWSNGGQLFWRARKLGATLTAPFDVPASGRYSVAVTFTRALDYGTVSVSLDGVKRAVFKGRAPQLGRESVSLGTLESKGGTHKLVLKTVEAGKAEGEGASQTRYVGIDDITLTPLQAAAVKVMSSPKARDARAPAGTAMAAAPQGIKATGIVLEGEAIRAKASRGEVSVQDMSIHGEGWSGGKQLYWEAPGEGAMLTLAPDVPAGFYEVTLFLTQGPGYSRIEAMGQQGVIPKSDVELYGPELVSPAQVSLGVLELGPELGFAIRIIGKDPRAAAYGVGIDRIVARARPQAAARE